MASSLQQAANIITTAAGWKTAVPKDGIFHFSLEGNLEFDLLSPENRTGIIKAEVTPLPAAPDEAEELCARLAKTALGAMKKHRSVLAVADGHVELYRTFSLTDPSLCSSQSPLPAAVRDFLNDLAWWKAQTSGSPPSAAMSFSMSGWSFGSHLR